jgi:hypothetical protein
MAVRRRSSSISSRLAHALGELLALLGREHAAGLHHGLGHAARGLVVLLQVPGAQGFHGVGVHGGCREQLHHLVAAAAAGFVLRLHVGHRALGDLLDLRALFGRGVDAVKHALEAAAAHHHAHGGAAFVHAGAAMPAAGLGPGREGHGA